MKTNCLCTLSTSLHYSGQLWNSIDLFTTSSQFQFPSDAVDCGAWCKAKGRHSPRSTCDFGPSSVSYVCSFAAKMRSLKAQQSCDQLMHTMSNTSQRVRGHLKLLVAAALQAYGRLPLSLPSPNKFRRLRERLAVSSGRSKNRLPDSIRV